MDGHGGLGDTFSLSDGQQYIVHTETSLSGTDGEDTSNNATGDSNNGSSDGNGALREQDRFLPIANVARIMKHVIPKSGKIAKDAKECVQECVSEFVSFITSEASDRCHQEKRKTINGEDILFAMQNLGFDNYVDPLKVYLQKYREVAVKSEKDDDYSNVVSHVNNATSNNVSHVNESIEELATDSFITANILERDNSQNVIYSSSFTDF